MTTANLLLRLRNILDEATAAFWDDDELYRYLSDGQREAVNILIAIYKAKSSIDPQEAVPNVLMPIVTTSSDTITTGQSTIALESSAYLGLVSLTYHHSGGTQVPVFIRELSEELNFISQNIYMADAPGVEYNARIESDTAIKLGTAASGSGGAYTLKYFAKPAEINGSTDPVLNDLAMEAVLNYGLSMALPKEKRAGEAESAFQKFVQMVKNLY